jgi:hypothetical protein
MSKAYYLYGTLPPLWSNLLNASLTDTAKKPLFSEVGSCRAHFLSARWAPVLSNLPGEVARHRVIPYNANSRSGETR